MRRQPAFHSTVSLQSQLFAGPLHLSVVRKPVSLHSSSFRFAAPTSSHESGRFDAPFPYEFVAPLSKCHESASGADGFPYSAFKVSFPWWRHLLLSFIFILRFAVVPSTWKSSLVVPLLKRDSDPAFFDSYRPISLASCAFKVFEDVSKGGFRWGADTLVCSLVDSLRLRHQVHIFVALTSGKLSTLAGSKPHWFVSMTWASQVVFGISLPISSAELCPRSVWAIRLPNHGLTLASHKGGSSHLSCSICWWTAWPPLSGLPSLVSSRVPTFADDLVLLAESQAHLQDG